MVQVRTREDDPMAEEHTGGNVYGRSNSTTSSEGQQEAGLMSLDPELYHVVKKLKEVSECVTLTTHAHVMQWPWFNGRLIRLFSSYA